MGTIRAVSASALYKQDIAGIEMALIQTGAVWQFENEFELEELLWHNLSKLLNLKPFKRQFSVRGQFCDILAIADNRQLVIIELKNVEDRYVVQQLTRYYDALVKEQPFGDEVDWQKPIRLIAIAPSFHSDTVIDCTYNTLNIELLRFDFEERDQELYLRVIESSSEVASMPVPSSLKTPPAEVAIAGPPRKLLNWLSDSPEAEFQGMMGVREQLLGFDKRIKEVVEPQAIIYGKGKTKPCAEIRRQNVGVSSKSPKWMPRLFLWLPDLDGNSRILRMIIGSDESWKHVEAVGYCPTACRTKRIWHLPRHLEIVSGCYGYDSTLQKYGQALSADGEECLLPKLVELALHVWLSRI